MFFEARQFGCATLGLRKSPSLSFFLSFFRSGYVSLSIFLSFVQAMSLSLPFFLSFVQAMEKGRSPSPGVTAQPVLGLFGCSNPSLFQSTGNFLGL